MLRKFQDVKRVRLGIAKHKLNSSTNKEFSLKRFFQFSSNTLKSDYCGGFLAHFFFLCK